MQSRAVDERHACEIENESRTLRELSCVDALPELLGIGEVELSADTEDDDSRIVRATLLELELGHRFRTHDLVGIVKSGCTTSCNPSRRLACRFSPCNVVGIPRVVVQ